MTTTPIATTHAGIREPAYVAAIVITIAHVIIRMPITCVRQLGIRGRSRSTTSASTAGNAK